MKDIINQFLEQTKKYFLNPAKRNRFFLGLIRFFVILLMALLTVGAILWAAGAYDLSFVKRAGEETSKQEQTQTDVSTENESTLQTENLQMTYSSNRTGGILPGASVTLEAFLESLKKDGAPFTILSVPSGVSDAFSLSVRANTVISKEVFLVNSYHTHVSAGEENRPQLQPLSGMLVLDRGGDSFDVFRPNGEKIYSSSFSLTDMTGLLDQNGFPVVIAQNAYQVLDSNQLSVGNFAGVNMGNRSTCVGSTGAPNNGITIYQSGELFGYQRNDGTPLTQALFTRAFLYQDGYAIALNKDTCFVLDESGEIVSQQPYGIGEKWQTSVKLTLPDTEGLESLGYFYFDHGLTRVRIRVNYDLYNGYYDVKLSDRELLMDVYGNIVDLPTDYQLLRYRDGVAVMHNASAGKTGLINYLGEWISSPVLDDAGVPSDGLIPVKYQGKWGMLNTEGAFVIPPVFDYLSASSGGVITAWENGVWHVFQMAK